MFDVLSSGVKVIFDEPTLTFRNLISLTSVIRPSSNAICSFTCGGHWLLFKPNLASVVLLKGFLLRFVKKMDPPHIFYK